MPDIIEPPLDCQADGGKRGYFFVEHPEGVSGLMPLSRARDMAGISGGSRVRLHSKAPYYLKVAWRFGQT